MISEKMATASLNEGVLILLASAFIWAGLCVLGIGVNYWGIFLVTWGVFLTIRTASRELVK